MTSSHTSVISGMKFIEHQSYPWKVKGTGKKHACPFVSAARERSGLVKTPHRSRGVGTNSAAFSSFTYIHILLNPCASRLSAAPEELAVQAALQKASSGCTSALWNEALPLLCREGPPRPQLRARLGLLPRAPRPAPCAPGGPGLGVPTPPFQALAPPCPGPPRAPKARARPREP